MQKTPVLRMQTLRSKEVTLHLRMYWTILRNKPIFCLFTTSLWMWIEKCLLTWKKPLWRKSWLICSPERMWNTLSMVRIYYCPQVEQRLRSLCLHSRVKWSVVWLRISMASLLLVPTWSKKIRNLSERWRMSMVSLLWHWTSLLQR